MKKSLIFIMAISFSLAIINTVSAQETQDITVSATVLQVIEFSAITNVSFGNVQTGSVAEIQANSNDGTTDSNSSAPTSGAITITGGSQDYIITQNAAGTLTKSDDNLETLSFTPRYFEAANNRTAAITGAGYTQVGGGSITLDIGGQLESPTVAGSFATGNTGGTHLQLEVAYVF